EPLPDSSTTCDALMNPVRRSPPPEPGGATISYQSPTRLTTSAVCSFSTWFITMLTPPGFVHTTAPSPMTRAVSAGAVGDAHRTKTRNREIRRTDMSLHYVVRVVSPINGNRDHAQRTVGRAACTGGIEQSGNWGIGKNMIPQSITRLPVYSIT